jgi:hypothetical protein
VAAEVAGKITRRWAKSGWPWRQGGERTSFSTTVESYAKPEARRCETAASDDPARGPEEGLLNRRRLKRLNGISFQTASSKKIAY